MIFNIYITVMNIYLYIEQRIVYVTLHVFVYIKLTEEIIILFYY